MTVRTKDVEGPAVHALLIGAGAYPTVKAAGLDLNPLTTPFRSVTRFAQWLWNDLHHPYAEIASVDVLASHPDPALLGGNPANLPDSPTMANVRAAFDSWYQRCDASPKNVGIFFFCGHGIEVGTPLIYTDDVGADPQRPLAGGIDIGTTFQAMRTCQAASQYFFIDACRQMPFEVMLHRTLRGEPLRDWKIGPDPRSDTWMMFSTSSGGTASGLANQPSVFTEALIKALNGAGCHAKNNCWVVDFGSLHTALTELLASGAPNGAHQINQSAGTGPGVIHELRGRPMVPVSVRCTPKARDVRLENAIDASLHHSNASDPWSFSVPADEYWVDVEWSLSDGMPPRGRISAVPPSMLVERTVP